VISYAGDRLVEFALWIWHKTSVPIFLERFVLTVFAAAVVLVAFTNPMGFDKTQRITGAIALIFAAYFVAHTVHKFPKPSPPASAPPVQPAQPGATQETNVGLFLECNFQDFPLTIPTASRILILQVHPSTIKAHAGLYEVDAPLEKSRRWPSEDEANLLPFPAAAKGRVNPNFVGLKCTLKKYGDPITADRISIRLNFSVGGTYDLFTDPLESRGAFADFTFYMVNYCYLEPPPPGTFDSGGGPSDLVVGSFSQTATVYILGESHTRRVPLTMPFRKSLQPNFILPGTHRRWQGFPPWS
jgi:hypothetical protein